MQQDQQDAFAAALVPTVGAPAAQKMWQHWQLVQSAQQRTNLTGIRTVAAAVQAHYLDALAALPHWPPAASLLDIGSGAGFPGLVLAIARPGAQVTLVEPRRLRADFLRAAIAALELANVRLMAKRIETLPPRPHACLIMRAVFAGEEKLAKLAPHAAPGGKLLIFRQGERPTERMAGPWHYRAAHVYGRAPSGAERRLDEWILSGALA